MKTQQPLCMALMAGLLLFGAASLEAAAIEGPRAHTSPDEVRIINNYGAMVNVYAEDANGRLHKLGRVGTGGIEEFRIPEAVVDAAYRVKVYPSHPLWSATQAEIGIKTNPIEPDAHDEITFWLEPDLTQSVVEYRSN